MRAQGILVAFGLLAVTLADGRPLPTGEPHRVGRGREEPVRMFWANSISDELATVQPQPGTAAYGDRFDLVDQAGYLGRAVVERVDEIRCRDVTYPRAQVRFIGGRAPRQTVGQVMALRPTLSRPQAARVLESGIERATFPLARNGVYHLVDLDGDRIADLAWQQSFECRPLPSSNTNGLATACVEVWRREAGGWQLLARADLPSCR